MEGCRPESGEHTVTRKRFSREPFLKLLEACFCSRLPGQPAVVETEVRRVVVTGATGNVGTSLVRRLADDPQIREVVGIARRRPTLDVPGVEWREADIERSDLSASFAGADAVVHLAWRIQPSRDLNALWRTNVLGSMRVFGAAGEQGVRTLVYASSVGAYSPGPKDKRVSEEWPTHGVSSSFYARHKAEVERRLDQFQVDHPACRVVRLRPALTFKREAATGIRRLFIGPFLPGSLVRSRFVPFVPRVPGFAFQAVHTDDVAEAYRLALLSDVRGAFNIAAEPLIDAEKLAELCDARPVSVPAGALRGLAAVSWRLRLQPSPPGWIDLALGVPAMNSRRAQEQLGWTPRVGAEEAVRALAEGLRAGEGADTPPLSPATSGPLRSRELVGGIGQKDVA
jgi:UDP-glucose 4-epimerase